MSLDLFGVFSAGVLTFFTPCLLPLIPIYLSAISGGNLQQAMESGRKQLVYRALLFVLGFTLVFVLLGLGASSIGVFLVDYRSVIKAVGGVLILLFGLKFVGFIQIPLFDRTIRASDKNPQTSAGWFNALIMGVVFAAGWSPCAGPILGSVLSFTASTASDPATGALYLGVYAIGVGLPLMIVAVFAQQGIHLLNRVKPHLATLEKALGLALIFVAGWLVLSAVQYEDLSAKDLQIACLQDQSEPGEKKVLMLAFVSDNCHVCKRMNPVLESITKECQARKLNIKTINITEPSNQHFAKVFNLVATPTFVFLDAKGTEVARLVGEQDENDLKQALSALVGQSCTGLGLLDKTSENEPFFKNDDPKPSCKIDASAGDAESCETPKVDPQKNHTP